MLSAVPLWPNPDQSSQVDVADKLVRDSITVSGWAPFHYDRNLNSVAEPWRMQVLFHSACRNLAADFLNIVTDLKPGNKLPAMMNACGAMVLVSWLPQDSADDSSKLQQVNNEHLAATSAAVQNLLLALNARGFGTYWSSGGPLGSEAVAKKFGITTTQSLVAAVFVDYDFLSVNAETNSDGTDQNTIQRIPGKNRTKRSSMQKWCREIDTF